MQNKRVSILNFVHESTILDINYQIVKIEIFNEIKLYQLL